MRYSARVKPLPVVLYDWQSVLVPSEHSNVDWFLGEVFKRPTFIYTYEEECKNGGQGS